MTRYRHKHTVEAMRWDGVSRELLTAWQETRAGKTPSFGDGQSAIVWVSDNWDTIIVGQWLVWSDGEFLVMDDEQFRETYEEG